MTDDEAPRIRELGRRVAARHIAVAVHRCAHHVIGCTGPLAVLATTAALHSVPAVHYLDDGHTVVVAPGPLSDELRDDIRQGAFRWAVSLVPTASMATATLAARLGCDPAPTASPAVFHRRPSGAPDRAPPLLRDALRRLDAYQRSTRTTRPERTPS